MTEINKAAQALSLSRPVKELTCKQCGETFEARDARAKFCGNRCRQADFRNSKKANN
jgi:endogenous inhibitor of DNA gyrase (YacG/DUF329 family)